jgi:hypothetical protein
MARATAKTPTPPVPGTHYEDDVYTWVQEQVALLRAGRLNEIDAINIAEELSDVGNEQLDKLESAIAVLSQHLLKWDYQPERRSRSWELTVREQRRRIARLLAKNPGLKSSLGEALTAGYADGRDRALDETSLPDTAIPESCPYRIETMLQREIVFGGQ